MFLCVADIEHDHKGKKGSRKMTYKKPKIVAKSEARKSYVAGCPVNKPAPGGYKGSRNSGCKKCEMSGL